MRVTCGADAELNGVMLATASGTLDVHGAAHFKETIPPRLTDDAPSLIVDMTEVDLMTSAGIGALIAVLNHLEPLGGKMSMFGCNKKVRRVLQICELESVLNVVESAEDARAAVSPD